MKKVCDMRIRFRYFRRTQEFIKNPCQYWQLRLRIYNIAPWVEKTLTGQVRHNYTDRTWWCAQLLTRAARLHPAYAPWVVLFINEKWKTSARFYTLQELRWDVPDFYEKCRKARAWKVITCPGCGRPDRTLTSTGKIRLHNIAIRPSQDGYGKPCPKSGDMYVEPVKDMKTEADIR